MSNLELDYRMAAVRQGFHDVASQEFARRRKRLGQLTPEQEQAIEALLLSTVEEIAHPVIEQMRRSYEKEQT